MPTPVRLPGLAHQLVAGRPVTVQTPDIEVLLDTTLMALILGQSLTAPHDSLSMLHKILNLS